MKDEESAATVFRHCRVHFLRTSPGYSKALSIIITTEEAWGKQPVMQDDVKTKNGFSNVLC